MTAISPPVTIDPVRLNEVTIKFVEELSQLYDTKALTVAMSEITKVLGFDVFVLGQLPSTDYARPTFYITNYSEAFRSTVYSRFKFGDDPVIDALYDASAPFLWEDAAGYKDPTPQQRAYLDASREVGLSKGYSVPIKVPGEPVGVVSFATAANSPVDRKVLPFASYVATAAYRRVRDVSLEAKIQQRAQIALSKAEITCLKDIARGHSYFNAARRMGISNGEFRTVRRSLYTKLGYSNRVSAVVRGLSLGYLTFNDALLG